MTEQKKTGFEIWFEKEYNKGQKERDSFKQADMRKAYEAAYHVAGGLVDKGVEFAWKDGYVVGFNEGRTYKEHTNADSKN